MTINIWSDVRCPFCYIGKRKLELALDRFAHKEAVEVIWHSFRLDPSLKTEPNMRAHDYLAKIKGMSLQESIEMHEHVSHVAAQVGLSFHFDKAVVADSYNAHRLIQMAKSRGKADAAEERLFRAHFTEGINIDDTEALIQIGAAIGLPEQDVRTILASSAFGEEVQQDEAMARSIGIRGVPFFIFNGKAAVSGAQSPEVFLQALEKAWEETAPTGRG